MDHCLNPGCVRTTRRRQATRQLAASTTPPTHRMLPREDPVHSSPCGVRSMAVTCPTRCACHWYARWPALSDMPGFFAGSAVVGGAKAAADAGQQAAKEAAQAVSDAGAAAAARAAAAASAAASGAKAAAAGAI